MKMRRTIIYSLCCASLLLSSCDLDVPVTDRLPDEEVWKDDNLITGVFSRLYNQMRRACSTPRSASSRRSTIPSSAKYRCSRSAETSGSICSDRKQSSFRFEKTTLCLGVVFSSCVSRSLGCVVSESGLRAVTG